MAKESKPRKRKCAICGAVYLDKDKLIDHIGRKHVEQIPEGWDAARYENYLRTNKTEGRCIVCGEPTEWNHSTGKYHRICSNPKCKKTLQEKAERNSINKYGVAHVLSDPEINKIQQRKMVYSKKNSGVYVFEDPDGKEYKTYYDSSYGKDFLNMLNNFLQFSGRDVIAPSPHTYEYEYDGKIHQYIPDVYIISLNLEVELKDGGDNPNNHPKIQAVDKVKERLKDETMERLKKDVNYIKIQNKDYSGFFALLSKLKDDDVVYLPKWDLKALGKSKTEVIESVGMLLNDLPDSLTKKLPRWSKRYAYVQDPIVSYQTVIDMLEDDIGKARTPEQLERLETEMLRISEYLGKVANDNSEYNSMSDEARIAKKKIDDKLLIRVRAKKKNLQGRRS